MSSTDKTKSQEKDPPKKGDEPNPAKVEKKRLEQSGKTFQQTGTEKRG